VNILVTNDDGIDSPGIRVLARALFDLGHAVLVVAPEEDMSGASAAIGRIRADQRIEARRLTLPEAPGVHAHAMIGPPGLAATVACLGGMGDPPDLVVSGINAGPNTGHAVLHSGTVGAALTAATFLVSGVAFSIEVSDPMRWETACGLLPEVLALVQGARRGLVLNVNVPGVPSAEMRGLRWATLDRFGRVRVAVAGSDDGWLQLEYRATNAQLDPESDTALLAEGFATVTAIGGIEELPPLETTEQGHEPLAHPTLTRAQLRG
jgi:5'-nucleotidase